jgi:transposase
MSKVNRNHPRLAGGSEATFTRFQFDAMFPDDAACLDWLLKRRFPDGIYCPNCKTITKHYRERSRPSYTCHCGHRIHPMQGTIFQDSATSLRLWFLAIFLMATTRCGIAAKHLEREIGVTYKCAWRMFKKIKQMLNEDALKLLGEIEVDEAFFGGKAKNRHVGQRHGFAKRYEKATVFGMAERGGKIIARVIPTPAKSANILPHIKMRIAPKSMVFSDEAPYYDPLKLMGYGHERVNHSQDVFVSGNAHVNTIEGFWSLAKRGIDGNHHVCGKHYLQLYLNSFAFRWNHRRDDRAMFWSMMGQIPPAPAAPKLTA